MSWKTSKAVVLLRNLGRATGCMVNGFVFQTGPNPTITLLKHDH